MNIDKIKINDFTYTLPGEKIAKYPLEKRDESKLLVYHNGDIKQLVFKDIYQEINVKSLLIFNNTKVIKARLVFKKPTGARIEIFCLEPLKPADYENAFLVKRKAIWKCLVGNLKKWKEEYLEQQIVISNNNIFLTARILKNHKTSQEIEFSWNKGKATFGEIIESFGNTPIPPYLNRKSEEIDTVRYQTIYSRINGSVAAPTSGLHFTNDIFKNLTNKNIQSTEVTLHIGAGTFKPVKEEKIQNHEMHTEFFSINKDALLKMYENLDRIIAVGTTSLRTIESLHWLGKKINKYSVEEIPLIGQWEPYESEKKNLSAKISIESVIDYMEKNRLNTLNAKTQIIILPGYQFKFATGLITNFHMPKSTLLLLVSAFVGEDWRKIYDYALKNNFRFLSYGDGSLLMRNI